MAEMRYDQNQAFWDIITSNGLDTMPFDALGIDEASYYPDIAALSELRTLGETTAVSAKRAALIEQIIDDQNEDDYRQLIYEVQTKFQLCDSDMQRAMKLAEERARNKKNQDIEWMEP